MSRKSFQISSQNTANVFVTLFHGVPLNLALSASYKSIAIKWDLGSDSVPNSQVFKVCCVLKVILVSGPQIEEIFCHPECPSECWHFIKIIFFFINVNWNVDVKDKSCIFIFLRVLMIFLNLSVCKGVLFYYIN